MNLASLIALEPTGCWCVHKPLLDGVKNALTLTDAAQGQMALSMVAKSYAPIVRADRHSDGPSKPYQMDASGIAYLALSGPLTKSEPYCSSMFGGTSTVKTRRMLRQALADPDVQGVMLVVDSPGGQVSGTSDLAADIKSAKKPVYGYAQDMAASAAYWLLSSCEMAFCNETAMIGSIGTYMVIEDTSASAQAQGVKVHVIASAPLKGAGEDGTEVTAPQLVEFQRTVNDLNAQFVKGVRTGRKMSAEQAQGVATGQVWIARDAMKQGLIDGVGSMEQATRKLQQRIAAGQPNGAGGKEKSSMGLKQKLLAVLHGTEEDEQEDDTRMLLPANQNGVHPAGINVQGNAPGVNYEALTGQLNTLQAANVDLHAQVQSLQKSMADLKAMADLGTEFLQSERDRVQSLAITAYGNEAEGVELQSAVKEQLATAPLSLIKATAKNLEKQITAQGLASADGQPSRRVSAPTQVRIMGVDADGKPDEKTAVAAYTEKRKYINPNERGGTE